MKLGIIGLGLMGGSFALDFKSIYPKSKIFGLDKSKINENRALELGLIDELITLEQLSKVDVVLVAIPVDKSLEELPKILNSVHKDTLVFDVGSTKLPICEALLNHPNRKNFLATHPMAGTEFSGPNAAVEGLYLNKNNIVCDIEKTNPKIYKKALRIFKMLNMNIIKMDSKSHDVHVAYVSHLSHISSFMLGKTVIEKEKNEKNIFDLAGSGFESTVRLAKSSPATWTPIFLQNKNNLVLAINEYISNLNQIKEMIEENNYSTLSSILNNTNRIKQILIK
ncbi:MAG: prephenate dehydrogenase [Flavobacteriaceae bacterium]|nr:prephenate dehydrogenase [Flavobacteriaceae bacterium]